MGNTDHEKRSSVFTVRDVEVEFLVNYDKVHSQEIKIM